MAREAPAFDYHQDLRNDHGRHVDARGAGISRGERSRCPAWSLTPPQAGVVLSQLEPVLPKEGGVPPERRDLFRYFRRLPPRAGHLLAKLSMRLSFCLGRAMAQELAERAATEKERELAMSDDFIPPSDDKFHDFQDHLIGKVSGTPEKYNHTVTQVTALATAQATWVTAFASHKKAQIEAHQKAQEKDHARSGLTTLLRSSVHMVNAIPSITNADRAELKPRAWTRARFS